MCDVQPGSEAHSEILRLKQHVDDLQSGMYVNCVYCGHRYGPWTDVPVTMAALLKEHIAQCPKHPMSGLRKALETISGSDDDWAKADLRRVARKALEALDREGEPDGSVP